MYKKQKVIKDNQIYQGLFFINYHPPFTFI